MFNRRKQPPIRSLIGAGTQFKGNVTFTDALRVDGQVVGSVVAIESSRSMVVVSEEGTIEGEVHAGHVIVNGHVRGPIFASELLELQPKARVSGDVHYAALEMHQGAQVSGKLSPIGGEDQDEDKPPLRLAASQK